MSILVLFSLPLGSFYLASFSIGVTNKQKINENKNPNARTQTELKQLIGGGILIGWLVPIDCKNGGKTEKNNKL